MVNKLRDLLAENELLRKKYFRIMIDIIREQQKTREKRSQPEDWTTEMIIMKDFF